MKLTLSQYQRAGRAILNDPRCTEEIKAAVRQGLSGQSEADGRYRYYPTGQTTWYDEIMRHAVAS